MLDDDDKLT